MAYPRLKAGRNETKTVDTDVHVVLGESDWDNAEAAGYVQQRLINLHNISGSDVYGHIKGYTTTISGAVSSTDKGFTISAGQIANLTLAPKQSVFITSASSTEVNAEEKIIES